MRIALVSPLFESVPPRLYGGTERIVSYLCEELVGLGHDVTLFASGDSRTRACLVPMTPRSLRLDPACRDPLAPHLSMLDEVAECAGEFDILHFHTEYWHLPIARRLGWRAVTTLHGRLDMPELAELYRRFDDAPLISISDAQRRPIPRANWLATVPHGLPRHLYRRGEGRGGYLAFLGRLSPEKQPDAAIRIALRAGVPLKIAAKQEDAERGYFDHCIKPLLNQPGIEFVGEIGEADKQAFLGNAAALLFPIAWPEPFGLVMIEAMACGTPVIAFNQGSVPEVLQDGITGHVVETADEAVKAVRNLALDRGRCRLEFERRFTAERMARDYLAAYALAAGRETEPALKTAGDIACRLKQAPPPSPKTAGKSWPKPRTLPSARGR